MRLSDLLNSTGPGSSLLGRPRLLDALAGEWRRLTLWLRDADKMSQWAVIAWVVVLSIISLRTMLSPRANSCYPIFSNAARNWIAGEDLYSIGGPVNPDLDAFRYSPIVACALTPFTQLNDRFGGVIWRLINAGVLLLGIAWWCKSALPLVLTRGQKSLLCLLVLPVAIGSLNNGQANALVIGLLLMALAAVAESRWNIAGVCLALACLLKIYPIALGLLLLVLYPRQLTGRFLAALGLGLALPFALHDFTYVSGQYVSWFTCLRMDDRHAFPVESAYRDLALFSRVWLKPISPEAFRFLEIESGAWMALMCHTAFQAGWSQKRLLALVLVLGSIWMTVFGPATESCTYILIGPALAWCILESRIQERPAWLRFLPVCSFLMLSAAGLEAWFGSTRLKALAVQPLAGLLLFAQVLAVIWSDTRHRSGAQVGNRALG
jgi:hypothetical protein